MIKIKVKFHFLKSLLTDNFCFLGVLGCFLIIIVLFASIMQINISLTEVESIQIEIDYEIEINNPDDFKNLLIPLGYLGETGGVQVEIDLVTPTSSISIWKRYTNEIIHPFTSYFHQKDGTGTPWLNISLDNFNLSIDNQFLIKHRLKRTECSALYRDSRANETMWLQPTKYIDSNHTTITKKAKELTQGILARKERVQKILNFVSTNIQYNISRLFSWESNNSYFGEVNSKASDVLRNQEGVCRHFSRLFVGLCRASGVPSRYVDGIMVKEDRSIEGHAWVEFLDENQNWNIVEPQNTLFEKYPVSYFHLIHGPLQNSSFFIESVWPKKYILIEDTDEIDVDARSPVCTEYESTTHFLEESWSQFLVNIFLCLVFLNFLFFFLILEVIRDWGNETANRIKDRK